MCKCPNCGSTAQVRKISKHLYLCGCGHIWEDDEDETAEAYCDLYC